jgi:hypothetical protein
VPATAGTSSRSTCFWDVLRRSAPTGARTIDRFSPRLITTAALIVGGVSLIATRLGGLYWLAGVDVCALLAGLLNAWIFLLAAGAEKET